MAKPSRVRYTGVGTFINDVQANRVQAFGSSSRLTTEDMKELGTLNIVEIVDDVPQVDISIDQNENGTMDLFALLANKGYGCQVVAIPAGVNVGSTNVKVLPGVYKGTGGHDLVFTGGTIAVPASANQVVYLINAPTGNQLAVAASGSVPAGSISLATVSGSAIIKQADIVDTRPDNMSLITHYDFELAYVDIFVPVKQSQAGVSATGGTVARTMYMEKAYVNNIDINYGTQGVGTISYRLETDNKRWFLNTAAMIVVDNFKATGAGALTLSQTPAVLANNNKTLCVYKNGVKLVEGTDYSVATNQLTITVLAANDLVKVRYVAASGGSIFKAYPAAENPHPDLAGGIKQGQMEIYLSDQAGNRATRVQSARISLPLQRDALGELGALRPYDRPMQLPVNANITLEFRDSDLEMFARFAGKDVNTATEIAIDDLIKNLGLTVKIYRENDVARAKLLPGHPSLKAIKTITITNLIPQSENWDVRTDSDATQTFEFLAHNISINDDLV